MKTKQQRIAELEAELAKLKAETERTPLGWKPEDNDLGGEDCFYLTALGVRKPLEVQGTLVKAAYQRMPLYRTMEEAERADRIRKNKMAVLRCIEKHNKGWQPDFKSTESKFYFLIGIDGRNIEYGVTNRAKNYPDNYFMRDTTVVGIVKKEMGNKILALFDMEEGEV